MAKDGKDDDKLEFTPDGETLGYISLDQARVLALQHARDNREVYRRYADRELVWEVASAEVTEDYYEVRLSYRPAGFRGRPGVEQFTIDKTGPIELRQILREPRPYSAFYGILAIGIAAVIGVTLGVLFAAGVFSSSAGDGDASVTLTSVIAQLTPENPARLVVPGGEVTVDVDAGSVDAPAQLIFRPLTPAEIPELPAEFTTSTSFDLEIDGSLIKPINHNRAD